MKKTALAHYFAYLRSVIDHARQHPWCDFVFESHWHVPERFGAQREGGDE